MAETPINDNKARDIQKEIAEDQKEEVRNRLFEELGDKLQGLTDTIKKKNDVVMDPVFDNNVISSFFKNKDSQAKTDIEMVDGVFTTKEKGESFLGKSLDIVADKLSDIYDVIKEQQEVFANFFLKESVRPNKDKDNNKVEVESFMDTLNSALKRIVDFIATPIKTAIPGMSAIFSFFSSFTGMVTAFGLLKIKQLPLLAKDFVATIGILTSNLFKIVKGMPLNTLNAIPATIKTIAKRFAFLGGILAIINSAIDINPNFEKTVRAFDNLMSGENVLSNLGSLFTAMFEDFTGMFTPTERLTKIINGISNIITTKLVPAFEFIRDEVFTPMMDVIMSEVVPRLQKALGYIDLVFSTVANFLLDVLGDFLESKLPVIFDNIGVVLKTFLDIFKNVVGPLFDGLMKQFDITFGALADIITQIINIFKADSIEQVGEALGNIGITLFKLLNDTIDNIVTSIVKALSIDNLLGMKEGEMLFKDTIPRLRTEMFDAISAFLSNLGSTALNLFNDVSTYIFETKIKFYNAIKQKINDFVQFFIDLIPSIDDLKGLVADTLSTAEEGVKALYNKIFSDDEPTKAISKPTSVKKQQLDELSKYLNDNAPNVVIMDNKKQSITTGGSGSNRRGGGPARTSPVTSPLDRHIFGTITSQD